MVLRWHQLTSTASKRPDHFDVEQLDALPPPARRFFEHSIDNGAPLHTVAEIRIRGEISLGDKDNPNYLPIEARQLLAPPFGFIWNVKAGKGAMRFSGSDAAYPEGSWSRFWLHSLLPVARVSGGSDHSLSSFGRYMGEAIFWSPASLLPSENVIWKEIDRNTAKVIGMRMIRSLKRNIVWVCTLIVTTPNAAIKALRV